MRVMEITLKRDSRYESLLPAEQDVLAISEKENVTIQIEVDQPGNYAVNIGDYQAAMSFVSMRESNYLYETKKDMCFRNFVGIAHMEIVDKLTSDSVNSRPLNIHASKATYEKALSYLRFIIENEEISTACFSVTKAGSNNNSARYDIVTKLNAGLKTLDFLINEWVRFYRDPCSKISTQTVVKPYTKSMPLDDRAIDYLSTNQDALAVSDSRNGDVLIKGKYFEISHLKTPVAIVKKDIFENQVVLYFVESFMSFLYRLDREIKEKNYGDNKTLSIDGVNYLSIDQILRDSGVFINYQREKIAQGIKKCLQCIRRLKDEFGCKPGSQIPKMPTPTQQVMRKQHYMTIFRLIHDFYSVGEPNWRGTTELYGLRNLPKIYEFVSLIVLLKALKSDGFELLEACYIDGFENHEEIIRPLNEANNYFVFRRGDNEKICLYYDIPMHLYANLDETSAIGTPVDLVHKRADKPWRPDFLIQHWKNDECRVHIIDAKYSNRDTVDKYHLDSCVMKYFVKTRYLGTEANKKHLKMIDSMTIAYSGESLDYVSVFRAEEAATRFQESLGTIRPFLGRVGISSGDVTIAKGLFKELLR